ncbi:MAG: hypothetical protein Q9167_000502 [Letrouitia subvulpina]
MDNGIVASNGSGIHTTSTSYSQDQQVTVLQETVVVIRKKFITDFDEIDETLISKMTIETFLNYIERQRLTHMPHRGSHWDKVLKWAEFFALQVSGYAAAVEAFVPDSRNAASLIWTASRALLQVGALAWPNDNIILIKAKLGPENARALETTFRVFYQLGLSISLLLRHNKLLNANNHIRREVGYAFNDLLKLVGEVTIHYRISFFHGSRETHLDFNSVFGRQMAEFHQRKNHITDAMWKYSLEDDQSMEIRSIRKWLSPRDRTLKKLLQENDFAPGHRDEYTCEWFQSHLLGFSRSKYETLSIHGPAGCGKSVLSSWIVERLQRPIGKKTYETLSCTVESDVPSEATSLAVVKRLLLQLLEKNVGHKDLFNSLVNAYNKSMSNDTRKLESALWDCFMTGIDQFGGLDHLMIVVDGLDEVEGGEKAAKAIIDQLGILAARPHNNVQIILFSRQPSKPEKGKTQSFAVTPDHTHEDLRLVIDRLLEKSEYFKHQGEHARESLVEQLLHAAHGNFLWAFLTTRSLKYETSQDAFMKAIKSAKDSPKTLEETLTKLTNSLDFSKSDTNFILSWMLIAERPLTLTEIKYLLQIDLQKKYSVERKTNVTDDVKSASSVFVIIEDDFVRFRHPIIRSHLLRLREEGKKLHSRQYAQADFTMRLLAYCNFNLHKRHDPSMELVARSEIDNLFVQHALLEYAIRNWTLHFRRSSLFGNSGALQLSAEFKAIFPSSTLLALLEWSCWDLELSSFEATHSHNLALQVRKGVFDENHQSVLQSLIVCGSAYRKVSQKTESSECFYHASLIGQKILSKYHAITVACTTEFLTVTEVVNVSSRTEFATHKEEMLRFIIEVYKHQHGKSHDLVIRYYKLLAQLYVDIHEEHKAESIWRELREIVIIRFGKGSEEETSISENLTIVLKKGDKKTDVIEYEQGIFDIVTELEVWNIRRIKLTIELALSYEARGEFLKAEELFVMLWRKLTEQCHHPHHHHGVDIYIYTIDVVIEYVRFLKRCHRQEEASNVLICIWAEYEEYDFESESLFLRLKVIGELMRSISLLSVAVAVFKKCWGWFKSRSKHEHTASCEVLVSETIEEIITTTATTVTTTSTTTTTSTEIVVKEIFESTLSRTTVTSETISICKSLISYYMKLENWSEAIEVTKRSLLVVWRSIVSDGGTIALPKDFGVGAIDIAISLAICHLRSQHYHEAEEIYIRIYYACRNSCHIDDERMIKAYTALIQFYKDHRQWHKMIEIYQELLVEYRRHLGATHALTIRTLYTLGSLCEEHGHGHAHEYYEEIITVLNHGSKICHSDALDAMFFMCRFRYESGHWHKLQTICKVLWETWKGKHHGHEKFTADFVEVLYLRYRYVLEHHVHCEYSVLRELIIEYRNTCLSFYGAAVSITIKAMIELAHYSMRSEKYLQEAISIYEEVLTKTKTATTTTVVSTTTITIIKKRLTEAYISVCHHESVSTTIIERAIKVVLERYEYLRIELGWAHVETLGTLREVILMYMKLKKQEAQTIVVRMLLEASIEIIKSEVRSKTLHEAGKVVGEIFITSGVVDQAYEMVEEMRLQIITGSPSSHNKLGFKLDKSTGRVSFVFLVTLYQVLRGQFSISYMEVMADYLTESVLYESYTSSLKSSTVVVIGYAARLRAFLLGHKRFGQIEIIQNQSYDIFIKKWSLNTKRETGILFYISLLEHIGDEIRDINIGDVACRSSVTKVRWLLENNRIQEAFEVAKCALEFINNQRAYHRLPNVPHGFKLSSLMALRGFDKQWKAKIEHNLYNNMLALSRSIMGEVLKACRESKIDFVRLQLRELNDLVALLGDQQNFGELESILSLLWASRDLQASWKSDTVIAIGRLSVQARYLAATTNKGKSSAIRLCEDINYNLRRVWGLLDPKTLEMSDLLSQLYTNMGHFREAQGVHENVLRLIVEGDDGDDRTQDHVTPAIAQRQVELLKQSFLRLKGWDKSPEVYKDLVHDLKAMPEFKKKKEVQEIKGVGDWNIKEQPDERKGKFEQPVEWVFPLEDGDAKSKKTGMNMKRATSNWGIGLLHREGTKMNGKVNGKVNGNAAAINGEDGFESASEEL